MKLLGDRAMKLVKHILKTKGHAIWSVAPKAPVYEAIQLMAEKGVGALLVLKKGKMVGIVSERDYARKVILRGKSSKKTPVKEIMSSHVIYTSPDQTVENCMALMTARRVRHLPVLDGDQLVGIISIGDLVRAIIAEQDALIQQLENYILNYTSIT
jgi:CBS domain-containing protein